MIFTCKTTNLNKAIQTVQRAISPFSCISASILQAIAIFRSIAWISKMLLSAIKWIPEKIGVLGLEEIAL